MTLTKIGVITQNNGVDPFLKGHGDSRQPSGSLAF